jgi:hypothetical protein
MSGTGGRSTVGKAEGGGTVHNQSNSKIGNIDRDGTVRNASNAKIGKTEQDGTVRNASNSRIGKVDRDGTVRNASNSKIGKIDQDGTVRNASNAKIGRIDQDGTVRNASNASIGRVSGADKDFAAAQLFFFNALWILSSSSLILIERSLFLINKVNSTTDTSRLSLKIIQLATFLYFVYTSSTEKSVCSRVIMHEDKFEELHKLA